MSNIYKLMDAIDKQITIFDHNDTLMEEELEKIDSEKDWDKLDFLRANNFTYVANLTMLARYSDKEQRFYLCNEIWYSIDKIFHLYRVALKYYEYLIIYYENLVLELLKVDKVTVNNYQLIHENYVKNVHIESDKLINTLKQEYDNLSKYTGDKHNKKYVVLDNGQCIILDIND